VDTSRRLISAPALTAVLATSGCAVNELNRGDSSGPLAGTLDGAGSSAQSAAQEVWIASAQNANGRLTVNYEPSGSGAGRESFLAGGLDFAGSDAATIALIFRGEITAWDDPRIQEMNPDAALPSAPITAVHRSDASGTTKNFTDYLAQAAPDEWAAESGDAFPYGGESAQGNSGVVNAVANGRNTIGYADASRAGDLTIVSQKVGDEFVAYTPEAAARVVEASPLEDGRAADDLAIALNRTITEPGTYPLVLVSYVIACRDYPNDADAELVRGYLEWVASTEAQELSAEFAGSAPLSPGLTERVLAAIEGIR